MKNKKNPFVFTKESCQSVSVPCNKLQVTKVVSEQENDAKIADCIEVHGDD